MTAWPSFHVLVRVATGLVLLLFMFAIMRIINSATNELEWSDLISVPGRDGGRPRTDWNQIGRGLGVVQCVWLPAVYVYSSKMDATGLALIMGVSLLYLGGVSAYAATLRSRQGTVTTVTDPVSEPTPVKTTVTETPPVKRKR